MKSPTRFGEGIFCGWSAAVFVEEDTSSGLECWYNVEQELQLKTYGEAATRECFHYADTTQWQHALIVSISS